MNLRHRSATPTDLDAAYGALAPFYGDDPSLRNRFGEAWEALCRMGAGRAAMVEDITNPAAPRAVGFGGRAFVTARLADELREGRHGPTAARHILRLALTGGEGLLDFAAIREAQAGDGLHLVLMHSAFPEHDPARFAPVEAMEALTFIFFSHHRGFRMREVLKDVFSDEERRWFGWGGLQARTDYRDGSFGEEPTLACPALMSIRREEAEANPGFRFAAVFAHHPQRLGLRAAHRELIEAALTGMPDEEVADAFAISLSAVKKRWIAIYDHVDLRLPGLLPATDPFAGKARGAERRRHLLAYVREHSEELAPFEE